MQQGMGQMRTTWGRLPRRVQIGLVGVVAVALVVMFLVLRAATRTEMVTVGDGLKAEQVGQAQEALEGADIEHETASAGTGLLVAAADRFRAQAVLLEGGMATGGGAHADCEKKFGESSGMIAATSGKLKEDVRACRANELENVFEAMAGVESAQVQLTMPEEELFADEETKPTAGVMLVTGGERLPSKTVGAVQKQVAASVQGMDSASVVVTDDSGNTLSDDASDGSASSRDQAKLKIEATYNAAFEAKLTKQFADVVGDGKVKVISNAELDMDAIVREVHEVGGEDNEPGVVRSQTNDAEVLRGGEGAADPGGVVGMASNGVDPDNRTAFVDGELGGAATGTGDYIAQEDGTEYDNDFINEAITVAAGTVRRHRLSVLVDESVPAETATGLQATAQAQIGGNPTDSFNFNRVDFADKEDAAAAADDSRLAVISGYVKWALLGLGLLGMAFFLRRSLNQRTAELLNPADDLLLLEPGQFQPMPIAALEAALADATPAPQHRRQELQRKVEVLAEQQPQDVANELRRWLGSNDGNSFGGPAPRTV